MVEQCNETGRMCTFSGTRGYCLLTACPYEKSEGFPVLKDVKKVVRCRSGHILGVVNEKGDLEIRHKGRTVTVSGISNVMIRCEQCGDEITVLTPGGCVLSMRNSRENEFANKQSGGLP